ncbi:anti-sigma factor antagonist [Streptomyces gobitricini]|uniref:Anti-sigma factor antagonist n=1 Tax=Streptomyces gobitricini TaxID=68211 RepID=A0ABP5ZS70_9ACTN
MPFPCYRLNIDHVVIELHEVIDFHAEDAAERELRTVMSHSGARTVIIDVHSPLVTAGLVNVLLRVHRAARGGGVVLCVVARRPLARKVFRISQVCRILLVAATLPGAMALARGCRPVVARAPRSAHGARDQ